MTILMTKIFWIFVLANLINVLLNTVKSIVTIKGNKWIASVTNAVCFGFYTIIIVLTANCDMPLLVKCLAVACVNFVGVFTIKFCEEKMTKDKLWVFNATCNKDFATVEKVVDSLKGLKIKVLYNELLEDKLYSLTVYSNNKKESDLIEEILKTYGVKYCAFKTEVVGK